MNQNLQGKSKNAPICKAIGCTRRTWKPHGFCFQHIDIHCVQGRVLIAQEKAARAKKERV